MASGARLNPRSLQAIDWQAPWLAPWRAVGEPLARRLGAVGAARLPSSLPGTVTAPDAPVLPQHEALQQAAQALWPHGGFPVRFAPADSPPTGMAYEEYIFRSAKCPTREGLHDFFNGLIWLHLPLTKRRLNQLHGEQMAAGAGAGAAQRGAVRDALTLFDENIALLFAPEPLWQALAAKNWPRLFGDLRPLWVQTELLLMGHALLEKLVQPRKAITAHVYRVYARPTDLAYLDAWLASDLSAGKLMHKPFAHLPVLGVPGWWPGQQQDGFYNDPQVFRPPRA